MERILNFRLLADGMVNKEGKKIKNIYRSADISEASKKDMDYLKEKNILNIIDLRNTEEITSLISQKDSEFIVHNNKIIEDVKQNDLSKINPDLIYDFMLDLYRNKFVNTEGFKNEMEYILSLNGDAFLFHCTAGKDRTGITGAILMYILNFDTKDIITEYLKIDNILVEHIYDKIKMFLSEISTEEELLKIKGCATVEEKFILEFISGVKDNYKTIDNYIRENLNLSDSKLNKLRKIYLED